MTTPWPQLPIGEVCRLINGRAFKPSDWGTSGVQIVRIQNLNDHDKPFNFYDGRVDPKHLINSGEVLLSWSGTPGTSFGCFIWARGPGILNQHIFRVEVDPTKMLKEFFVHAVNERLEEMIGLAHGGVGLRHITKGKLESIKVGVPKLDVQRRVVAKIQAIMDGVAEMRRLRRERDQDVARLVPATLDDVFNEFPRNHANIGDVLSFGPQNGLYVPKDQYSADGIPMVHMGDMFRRFELAGLPERRIRADSRQIDRYRLQVDDVLVARRSLVFEGSGSMTAVGHASTPMLFESSIIRIRPDTGVLLPAFLVAYFYSREGTARRLEITRKATISGINQEGLLKLRVPTPSLADQRKALARIEHIRSVHAKIVAQDTGTAVEALPAAVLRKAFAGEL